MAFTTYSYFKQKQTSNHISTNIAPRFTHVTSIECDAPTAVTEKRLCCGAKCMSLKSMPKSFERKSSLCDGER
jgi:hypothetical protein